MAGTVTSAVKPKRQAPLMQAAARLVVLGVLPLACRAGLIVTWPDGSWVRVRVPLASPALSPGRYPRAADAMLTLEKLVAGSYLDARDATLMISVPGRQVSALTVWAATGDPA